MYTCSSFARGDLVTSRPAYHIVHDAHVDKVHNSYSYITHQVCYAMTLQHVELTYGEMRNL